MKTLLVVLLSLQPSMVIGGNEVGNGGDLVICTSSRSNSWNGPHLLDLVMSSEDGLADLKAIASARDFLMDLESKLVSADTAVGRGFGEFRRLIDNTRDWSEPRIWRGGSLPLIDIKDEQLIRALPENCDHRNLRQLVVRQKKADVIIYNFDSKLLDELRKTSPLQESMLYVHEWLWDHLVDTQLLREANLFFHSEYFASMNPEQIKRALKRFGIGMDDSTRVSAREVSKRRRYRIDAERNIVNGRVDYSMWYDRSSLGFTSDFYQAIEEVRRVILDRGDQNSREKPLPLRRYEIHKDGDRRYKIVAEYNGISALADSYEEAQQQVSRFQDLDALE